MPEAPAATDEERLISEGAALLAAACKRMPRFHIEVDAGTLMVMIAHLQLSLRHPTAAPPDVGDMRQLIESLISLYPPEAQHLLNLGFNPQHDQPCSSPSP